MIDDNIISRDRYRITFEQIDSDKTFDYDVLSNNVLKLNTEKHLLYFQLENNSASDLMDIILNHLNKNPLNMYIYILNDKLDKSLFDLTYKIQFHSFNFKLDLSGYDKLLILKVKYLYV